MSQIVMVLVLVGTAVSLMLADIICVGVVVIWLGAALVLTGILTSCEALAGFASSAVIALLVVPIVIVGLSQSGFTHRVGALLQQLAGCRFNRLLILPVLVGAFLGFFVNTIAAAVVLVPA